MPDVTISFKIPAAKAIEALAAFLAVKPNITSDPTLWDGDPLADAAWLKYCIRQMVNDVVDQGRRHLHRANNPEPVAADFTE